MRLTTNDCFLPESHRDIFRCLVDQWSKTWRFSVYFRHKNSFKSSHFRAAAMFSSNELSKKPPKLCRSIYQRFIAALLWGDADEMTSCRQHNFSLLFPLMWCGENIIMQFYLEWFTISKNDRFCIRVLMFYQKKKKIKLFCFCDVWRTGLTLLDPVLSHVTFHLHLN